MLDGTIRVGRLVRMAVERHVEDLEEAAAGWDYWFDASEANFRIAFIEALKHSKGEWAGQQIVLEPWQCFLVAVLFGWKRTDGTRRFRRAYIEIARKNGKSTCGAAIGHSLFLADGEGGAEVYTAGTKRDQAKIVHEEAKRMVLKSPMLHKAIKISRDNLYHAASFSKYEPLGADADTLDGLNLSGAIVDEIHAHPTRELWDVLDTATGSRRQPLMVAITTAGSGSDREGICWELHQHTERVMDGSVEDESWFGLIYALDGKVYDAEGNVTQDEDDWTDAANWIKANPNLGVSVKEDDLVAKFQRAQETPAAQANFRRKHLNQWTESIESWLPAGLWSSQPGGEWYGNEGLLLAVREQYRGQACYVGGDLSATSDLTGLVFAFRSEDGVDVVPFCWCPRGVAVGRSRDRRTPYWSWSQQGLMTLTEGESVDYEAPRALLRRARDEWGWNVVEVAMDPYNATHLLQQLAEEDDFVCFEHRQGYLSMNEPIKATERLILDRRLRHGGHAPLAWCIANAVIVPDEAGNKKFSKKRAGDKIDLAVAMVMAVGRAVMAIDEGPSVYESRGVMVV